MSSTSALAGQNPTTPLRAQPRLRDDPVQQTARIVVQVARRRADLGIVEDRGVRAAQLPGREERRPVDPLDKLGKRIVVERPDTEELGGGGVTVDQSSRDSVRPSLGDRQVSLLRLAAGPIDADGLVLVMDAGGVGRPPGAVDERARDADRP